MAWQECRPLECHTGTNPSTSYIQDRKRTRPKQLPLLDDSSLFMLHMQSALLLLLLLVSGIAGAADLSVTLRCPSAANVNGLQG
jgi:hypothetical protein